MRWKVLLFLLSLLLFIIVVIVITAAAAFMAKIQYDVTLGSGPLC